MAKLIENIELHNRNRVFADRAEAGLQLAEMLRKTARPDTLVLAIPSGGVPVGLEIAQTLGLDFDLVLVRKVA
jgi:predicted phosphoribosyltransferase